MTKLRITALDDNSVSIVIDSRMQGEDIPEMEANKFIKRFPEELKGLMSDASVGPVEHLGSVIQTTVFPTQERTIDDLVYLLQGAIQDTILNEELTDWFYELKISAPAYKFHRTYEINPAAGDLY